MELGDKNEAYPATHTDTLKEEYKTVLFFADER